MKTRVRPTSYSPCPWSVDVYNPYDQNKGWTEIGSYQSFWYANWRANRLAKGSLIERFDIKKRFIGRLKFGNDNGE